MIYYPQASNQFFNLKDIGTLLVGIAALLVSVTSLVMSNRQKKKDNNQRLLDNKLSLRKQLTEVLEKLSNLNIEWGKYDIKRMDYPENFRGILSDQRRFFVRQADYIARQIDDSVSTVECRLLAQGFDSIDDVEQAVFYFMKAISKAQNYVDKIISRREYSKFIFLKNKVEGDKSFKEIFEDFPIEKPYNSRLIYYIATTYERWANLYKNDVIHYKEKIELSIEVWKNNTDEVRRKFEIERLKALIN